MDFLKKFYRNAPITSTIFVINFVIFVLNNLVFAVPIVSTPHVIDLGLFLSHFSHVDLMHFGFNMLICLQMGTLLERTLPRKVYVFILLILWLSLVALGYLTMTSPALGFSGIAIGMMSMLAILMRHKKEFSKMLLQWVGLNIVLGLVPGISLLMHLWGAIVGAILGFLLERYMKKNYLIQR